MGTIIISLGYSSDIALLLWPPEYYGESAGFFLFDVSTEYPGYTNVSKQNILMFEESNGICFISENFVFRNSIQSWTMQIFCFSELARLLHIESCWILGSIS